MPPAYKYTFITEKRMRALELAISDFNQLKKQLIETHKADDAMKERLRIINMLLAHAALHPLNSEDILTLESLISDEPSKNG